MTVAPEERNSKSANTETSTNILHNTNDPEHVIEVHIGVAVELHLDLTQQTDKMDNKISTTEDGTTGLKQQQQQYEDGYDTQESALDLSPEPRNNEDSPFTFDNVHKGETGIEKNINKVADIQKRERDARHWAVKSILLIGTASVALSTIYDSYVDYCEGNGTKPLPISQLERLLKNTFPGSAIQNVEVHGVKKRIFVGLQILFNIGSNQMEMGPIINTLVTGSDHTHNLSKKNSEQLYNNDHSQMENTNLGESMHNSVPSMFDFEYKDIKSEPVDLSIKKPLQSFGGKSIEGRIYEPIYGTEAEQIGKINETRRIAQNYQHEVESRCPTYGNINLNHSMITVEDDVENCKSAAQRLSHVITWMKENGHTKMMLKHFAHSASCNLLQCSPFCMMFRRVRRHVMSAKHQCVLLRLFSLLLRSHANSCTDTNCGLQSCPTLKVIRDMKRNATEEGLPAAKRPAPFPIKQSDRVISNPIFSPTSALNDTGNKLVVVLPHPANRMRGSSIGRLNFNN